MSSNGVGYAFTDRAQGIANYPHCRRANGLIFVSGISSRRLDNTYVGVTENEDGTFELDIKEQTRAVLENIKVILERVGAGMENIIDAQVFLVNMDDYKGMNEVYNEYFDAQTGPTRTTVAVHQLPNPVKLLVEIKVIALDPSPPSPPPSSSSSSSSLALKVGMHGLALVSAAVLGSAAFALFFNKNKRK